MEWDKWDKWDKWDAYDFFVSSLYLELLVKPWNGIKDRKPHTNPLEKLGILSYYIRMDSSDTLIE